MITLPLKELKNAVKLLSKVFSTKSSVLCYSSLLIEKKENSLKFSALNASFQFSLEINLPGEKLSKLPERILILAKPFCDLVIKAEKDFSLNCTEKSLKIVTEFGKFSLNLLDQAIFQDLFFDNKDFEFSLNNECFLDLKTAAKFSAVLEETNQVILSTVNVKNQEGKLNIGATNGHYLAFKEKEIDNTSPFNLNIPSSTIQALPVFDNDVLVQLNSNKTLCKFEAKVQELSCTIVSRLISGVFPDYLKLIPVAFSEVYFAQKLDFKKSIEQIKIILDKSASIIFTFRKNLIELKTESDLGEGLVECAMICFKTSAKEDLVVNLSIDYLAKIIEVLSGAIKIQANSEKTPFIFTDDTEFSVLLMPKLM